METLTNLLVESLPPQLRASLNSLMTEVPLTFGQVLHRPGEMPAFAYFPTSGLVSIVNLMAKGRGVEVGAVGREGLIAGSRLLGLIPDTTTVSVQIEGSALRIPFTVLRAEFRMQESLRTRILEFVQSQMLQLAQIAGCNIFHHLEQRLARWLLMVQDRVGGQDLILTQEFLAAMLGVGRPTLNVAALSLQRKKLIDYNKGTVWIVDRSGLEGASCECYGIIRACLRRELDAGLNR